MLSFNEFNSQDKTIALFLHQRIKRGDVAAGHSQVPSIKATLCLADIEIITDHLQLSKLSPLKMLETKGCPG